MLSNRIEAGSLDISGLARRWKLLDELYATAQCVLANRNEQLLCARTIDEGQTAGHRLYPAVERCLGIARDNHDALVALLKGQHGLSLFAPWNLLRPTFEASFYAAWLLDPEESAERRRRGLRLEWLDEREHQLYYEGVLSMAEDPALKHEFVKLQESLDDARADNEKSYGADAAELGLPFPKMPGINILDSLDTLSHAKDIQHLNVLLKSTWRSLSGQQHGRTSAILRAADKSERHPTKRGVYAFLSPNDDAFLTAANTTTSLHMAALRLLLERSTP